MSTSMTSVEESTEEQWKQIKRVIEDAVPKAVVIVRKKFPVDKNGAQTILMSGDQIQDAVVDAIIAKFKELTITDQYADEVAESQYTYPPEYSLKSLPQQIEVLLKHFPDLKVEKTLEFIDKVLPTLKLPDGAEGCFAIPSWEKIAPTYHAAVQRILSVLASARKFHNYRENQLDEKHLRQHARTIAYLAKLAEGQNGDILIIPAQFGMKHRGESTRRARETFRFDEFGFGWFAVGCMYLTHPDRAVRFEELDTDCPGDEFSDEAVGDFSSAPRFVFHSGQLKTGSLDVSIAYDGYGSVSGFLPQYPSLEASNI